MATNPTITFETKCWEKDWKYLLKTNLIKKNIDRNNYLFEKKVLMINNISNYTTVTKAADKLINNGTLTDYFLVDDYAEKTLNFFNLTKKDLGSGYYYSISELVSIFLCTTEYLLHYSSDSKLKNKSNWIHFALNQFEQNSRIKVANPTWNDEYTVAQNESIFEDNRFFKGFGFSDQCYLIKTKDFKQNIYKENNPLSNRYPSYGGELFEKRVDSWMRNNNYYRITYKHDSYYHSNFPKKVHKIIKRYLKEFIS